MEAKMKQNGEIAIVTINGPLDIEKTQPFHDVCERHMAGRKVVFDLQNTNFVGSTGIQSFIETLKMMSQRSDAGVRLIGLKSEFRRIFSSTEIRGLEIHETEQDAITSFATAPADVIPSTSGSTLN